MWKWLLSLFRSGREVARPAAPQAQARVDEPQPPPPFLRREPLLDRDQQLVAYEFSVEPPAALKGRQIQPATRKFFDGTLIDHFLAGQLATLLDKRLVFMPVSPFSLEHPRLALLPTRNLVVVFDAPPGGFDRLAAMTRLADLSKQGFQLACSHSLTGAELAPVLAMASYIILEDVAAMAPPDLVAACRGLAERYPSARLIARNINATELYQACRKLGVHYFQGPFLTRREVSPANKIAPYRMFVVKLLNGLRNEMDYGDLAAIAWCDPALGYRLLNFVNSSAFGLREKIERLSSALSYVGRNELQRWLTLLLFSSTEPNPLDEALRENALVRAKLAEALAAGRMSRRECDEVFVVGVLSVIDALLAIPMEDALSHLSLPEAVVEALRHHEGKYAPYLQLAIACEESDQATIQVLAGQLGTDADHVNSMHIQALAWTMDFNENLA